jgi:hypothetical protein
MDLRAVQVSVRVIRKVNDLEKLIAELTSPSCTLEGLKVKQEPWLQAPCVGGKIRERFASALGASKTLKSLDVAFCSDMLKVDDLCTLLQSNEVLKSLTVCSRFAKSRPVAGGYTSLRVMLEQNSTLKRLGIAHLHRERWDLTELAGVLGSQSLLEQLRIDLYTFLSVESLEKIFKMLAVNTNLRCLELTCNDNLVFSEIPCFDELDNALSAVFSRNMGSDHQANKTLTRLVLPVALVATMANILRSNRTIRELVLTEEETRLESGPLSQQVEVHPRLESYNTYLTPPVPIFDLLQALQQNNTLRLLDLSGCSDVREEQDLYDTILNCLVTKPWLHLNLQHTPLSKSKSRFTTIEQRLEQNAEFRKAFEKWNPKWVNSTGARVFLCGSPRAGKCRSHLPSVMSHIIFFEQILTSKGGYSVSCHGEAILLDIHFFSFYLPSYIQEIV